MVEHPADHRWSSYRANAQGEANLLVTPHDLYQALGQDPQTRQAAYRELFRHELEPGMVDHIRQATNGNYALGSALFGAQIEAALKQRAMPGKAGRPKKPPETQSGELF